MVLEEKCELLGYFRQFHWNESELDLRAAVTVDLSRSFETDLRQEFLKDVSLGRLIVVIQRLVCCHDESRFPDWFTQSCAGSERAAAIHTALHSFHITACGRLDSHRFLHAALVLLSSSIAGSITFSGAWSIGALSSAFLSFTILSCGPMSGSRWVSCLLSPPFLLLFNIIDGHKGNGRAVWSLHIDLSRQRPLIRDLKILSVLLSENDIAEVDRWILDLDQGFLASADQWDIDLARFT